MKDRTEPVGFEAAVLKKLREKGLGEKAARQALVVLVEQVALNWDVAELTKAQQTFILGNPDLAQHDSLWSFHDPEAPSDVWALCWVKLPKLKDRKVYVRWNEDWKEFRVGTAYPFKTKGFYHTTSYADAMKTAMKIAGEDGEIVDRTSRAIQRNHP